MATISTILAIADEFTIYRDEDDWVRIVDGEQVVRLTLPFDTLIHLSKQLTRHHK